MTSDDASGLTVARTWTIRPGNPPQLVEKVQLRNASTETISTTIIEPIAEEQLRHIKFSPVPATLANGIARFDVTVAGGGAAEIGYSARLEQPGPRNLETRLSSISVLMNNVVRAAQPTDPDKALASMPSQFTGQVRWIEDTRTGIGQLAPTDGRVDTIRLSLTPQTASCRVPARGCSFAATDAYTDQPRLAEVQPEGLNLVGTALLTTRDVAAGALQCGTDGEFTILSRATRIEPSRWTLTWSGWSVTAVNYTIEHDLNSVSTRCLSASRHTVRNGTLTSG